MLTTPQGREASAPGGGRAHWLPCVTAAAALQLRDSLHQPTSAYTSRLARSSAQPERGGFGRRSRVGELQQRASPA